MTKKPRVDIPVDVAARVLFESDRTCCVCRVRGKPVQIHHIDDDHSNSSIGNLAVLCFDCHRDTQIRGGFDRKLDAAQIVLYRDNWRYVVARQHFLSEVVREEALQGARSQVELATSLAEIYRENQEYDLLAMHFHSIENYELRDKYIDFALQGNPTDDQIVYLRGLQDRPGLIPKDVADREFDLYTRIEDWSLRARFGVNP
jgi:hypothetical protein